MVSSYLVPLSVFIDDQLIGVLTKFSNGALSFRYSKKALDNKNSRVISLSMSLTDEAYTGDRVLSVFENLLPDNKEIRNRIAEKRSAGGSDAFSLLSKVGRDCVGAMQFFPYDEPPEFHKENTGHAVGDAEIAKIIRDLSSAPLGMGEDDEEFRISIAGAQEKTSLLLQGKQWMVPHGTTPTTHILKKPMGLRSDGVDLRLSCENEHFCMTFLKELSIDACSTEIKMFEDEKAIVIERFDRRVRPDGSLARIHQEDMCQALSVPSASKYQKDGGPGYREIFRLLRGSDEFLKDTKTMMSTMVIYWLLAASDGHAKNFSVFLSRTGRFKLTPLYDVMSIQPIFDAGQIPESKVRVAMSIGRQNHYIVSQIVPRHFYEMAKACAVPDKVLNDIFDEVISESASAFDRTYQKMPDDFPFELADSIRAGFNRRVDNLKDLLEKL